jgi:gamma-glutamyltranspeptidase
MNWKSEIKWLALAVACSAGMEAIVSGGDLQKTAEFALIGGLIWAGVQVWYAVAQEIRARLRFRRAMLKLSQATPEQIEKVLDRLVEQGYIVRVDDTEVKE